jgi:uncharacterized protein DUF6484
MNTSEFDDIEVCVELVEPVQAVRESDGSVEHRTARRIDGTVRGVLIGFRSEAQVPLVLYCGQPGNAALAAASVVDLHGAHIGREIMIAFENADPFRPVVLGLLRDLRGTAIDVPPGQVELEADGERLIVAAREQLVLRCGKASIVLTKAGKVVIKGEYIVSRATGTHRIKGGSVQIN